MLIGAAQAALLALLIFQKYDRLNANRFLGVLMVIYAIILTNLILSDSHAEFIIPHLFLIPLGLTLLIGPLNYLYANFLLYPMRKFHRIEIYHFLPFFIYELTIVPDFFKSKAEILQLFYLLVVLCMQIHLKKCLRTSRSTRTRSFGHTAIQYHFALINRLKRL